MYAKLLKHLTKSGYETTTSKGCVATEHAHSCQSKSNVNKPEFGAKHDLKLTLLFNNAPWLP